MKKRFYIELDKETLAKLKIYCFLKDTKIKHYITQLIRKELEPYQYWFKNTKENNEN